MRTAIGSIAADAEDAFDDGWPLHPLDKEDEDDASARFRTVYLGGAGVVDALRRLAQRGFVELRRDYVPYLEHSLEAEPDFPDEDAERSLWMGETGIRLVLQRLAPSRANLERLSELIAANEQDERCELMWGSPGTILAGRELGLDVTASIEWLRSQRDTDGLWTQQLAGRSSRHHRPGTRVRWVRARARRSHRRHGDARAPCRRGGRARQLAAARRGATRRNRRRTDPHAVVPWRAGHRRDARATSLTRSSRSRAAS